MSSPVGKRFRDDPSSYENKDPGTNGPSISPLISGGLNLGAPSLSFQYPALSGRAVPLASSNLLGSSVDPRTFMATSFLGAPSGISSFNIPALTVSAAPSVSKPSLEQIYGQIGNSVCKVQTTNGTATGIFIGNGFVVVPLHVVGLERVKENEYTYATDSILCFYGGKVFVADLCKGFPLQSLYNLDCAVFKINDPDFKDPGPLECLSGDIKPGREVFFAGYPLIQNDPTYHKGNISCIPSSAKISYFTIDGTVVPGNSGGPVFVLENNKVVLAGFITHQVAELNPEFVRASGQIVEQLKKGKVLIAGVNINIVVSEMMKVMFDNISTGIGSAIHVRHLLDLLKGKEVPQSLAFMGLAVKHGTLRTETVSRESIVRVKNSVYDELLLFFFELLKSGDKKVEFYTKLKGQQGTIYSGDDWRIDRQAPPKDGSANVQVQHKDRTVATVVIDAKLLMYGGEENKIREVVNYVAFQFTHALKYSKREQKAVVLKVLPKA